MDQPEVVIGTCDGTAVAINVCLGFVPSYVKAINMEDGGNLLPMIEWNNQMALIAAMAEGIKYKGISDTDYDRTVLADASGGIDAYDGDDEIVYDGETNNRWEDSDGNDVEEKFVDGHYNRKAATDAAYRCIGDALVGSSPRNGEKLKTPSGFTIGTDSDINVNGEQICWVAFR